MLDTLKYQNKAIPPAVTSQPWRVREIRQKRERIISDSHFVGNVLYWTCVNRPVPPHVFAEAFVEPVSPREQVEAYEAYQAKAIAEYRAAMAARTPEQIAEQRAEARAELGEGVELVNVLTGERYRT